MQKIIKYPRNNTIMLRNRIDSPIEKIVILIAMPGEADPIIKKLHMQPENPEKYAFHPQLGLQLYHTIIQEKSVFLVINGIDPIHHVPRVGTQAAALTAFTVIEKLKPDTIINAGTAGGLKDAQIGDIFVSNAPFVYIDRRISLGKYAAYGKGSFPYLDLSGVTTRFSIKPGVVATGNSLDASAEDIRLSKTYDADVIDMEAAAIAEVAGHFGIRMIALKSVTNFIDDNIHADFEKNYSLAVTNLAEKVAQLVPVIINQRPSQLSGTEKKQESLHDTAESSKKKSDVACLADVLRYETLTKDTILPYVLNIRALRNILGADSRDQIEAKEIGDGNLNFVFLVQNKQEKQKNMILKQATPYLRCAGEGYPLAKERMHYEIRALQKFAETAPTHTPRLYHSDHGMCLMAMEYLDNFTVLRNGMIKGIYYPKLADHLSTFLAESLFKTSSLFLSSAEKSRLVANFNSNELRKLSEDFVFTHAFMPHASNTIRPEMQLTAETLWGDTAFKHTVLHFKNLFMNKTEALLHGDLHTGSLMVNTTQTYIIDPEFAFMGPFGFDTGALLANLIMSWVSHFERSHDKQYQEWILTTIQTLFTQFEEKFLRLWKQQSSTPLVMKDFLSSAALTAYQEKFMRTLLCETIGFAGCKIARRQLGLAGVEDIRGIENPEARTRAEKMALAIARECVVNYERFYHVNHLIAMLRKFSAEYYPAQGPAQNKISYKQIVGLLGAATVATASLTQLCAKKPSKTPANTTVTTASFLTQPSKHASQKNTVETTQTPIRSML